MKNNNHKNRWQKSVFLNCYCYQNVGDDLFIKTICERYPNTLFRLTTKIKLSENSSLLKIKNLKIYHYGKYTRMFFGAIARIRKNVNFLDRRLIRKSDMIVTVAGSFFMEPKNRKAADAYRDLLLYEKSNIPFYIIGANIGPVYSKDYLHYLNSHIFNKASDICVRDKSSFDMISNTNSKRLAPDILFSLEKGKSHKSQHARKVGISVIDCERKASQMKGSNYKKYEDLIIKIIRHYKNNKYKVELISFCNFENDDIAINRIKERCDEQVDIYAYDGDIDKMLEELDTLDIIFGTRFHANVIGFLFGKIVVPISYNDKTENLLKDMCFKGEYVNLQKACSINFDAIGSGNIVKNIQKLKKESLGHFRELDKILR